MMSMRGKTDDEAEHFGSRKIATEELRRKMSRIRRRERSRNDDGTVADVRSLQKMRS